MMHSNIPTLLQREDFQSRHSDMLVAARSGPMTKREIEEKRFIGAMFASPKSERTKLPQAVWRQIHDGLPKRPSLLLQRISDGHVVTAMRYDEGDVVMVDSNGLAYQGVRDRFVVEGRQIVSDMDMDLMEICQHDMRLLEAASHLEAAGYRLAP